MRGSTEVPDNYTMVINLQMNLEKENWNEYLMITDGRTEVTNKHFYRKTGPKNATARIPQANIMVTNKRQVRVCCRTVF